MIGLHLIIACIAILFLPLGGIIYAVVDQPIVIKTIAGCVGASPFICYLLTRLWLASIFLADRNARVFDSIRDAWQVSSGNFWKLFVSIIVFFPCVICVAFLCVCVLMAIFKTETDSVLELLLVYTVFAPFFPIIFLGSGLTYLQLTGQSHYLEGGSEESGEGNDNICAI
jgi:hypothetical protein